MTKYSTNSEENRTKAATLYVQARELEAQRDYDGAIKSYVKSLRLYDDLLVKAAYFKLLATIGPM
jgi:tetratricopeptide (TPR) repeat protein